MSFNSGGSGTTEDVTGYRDVLKYARIEYRDIQLQEKLREVMSNLSCTG